MSRHIGRVIWRCPLHSVRYNNHCIRTLVTSGRRYQNDKKLFTPGPLGVSMTTKEAMHRDVGSRDTDFVNNVKYIRHKLVELAGVSSDDYTCVPLQGSGTYSLEAVLSSTVPVKTGKVLILENGAYGKRQKKICDVLKIAYHCESFAEDEEVSAAKVTEILREDASFSHVTVVHCETSSGVINPIQEIGQTVKQLAKNAVYFVDAMSSFGAIPFNLQDCHIDYMTSSANKCIEGVPGFGYVIARTKHLLSCEGLARSYSLDLVDQYKGLEDNGQFRFTPPTHAILAFRQALEELEQEGGVAGRSARYQKNHSVLQEGMNKLGFQQFLNPSRSGYIITSYCFPQDTNFDFKTFYQKLSEKDQVIYPGKVLNADCFRIGNIGHLFPKDMEKLLTTIEEVCKEMDIKLPVDG